MKRLTLLFALLLMFTSALSAQTFMVMSVKGKVEVQRKNAKKKEWKALSVGDQLQGADVVRTAFASYAKLMMNQERLVSIDENTTKVLSTFATASKQAGDGASGKLLQYAASQIRRTREGGQEDVYGAVRGTLDVVSAVFPKQALMTTEPLFRWIDPSDRSEYHLLLLDDNFAVIARLRSGETQLRYEPGVAPALANGGVYHWRITRVKDGSESNIETFRILSADSIAVIQEELRRLDVELRDMGADDVTLHLIRGIYFEQKGLFNDAFVEYSETRRLAPDVAEYRDILRNLLMQMRLYNEEEYLLK